MSDYARNQRPTLAAIITAARAGSLAHATALFKAGGYDRETSNSAALAVKGRLLKDQALRAPSVNRPALYEAAAQAYGEANRLNPQPYTRINEASLLLLAGKRDVAIDLALALQTELNGSQPIAETPYYIAATRAEAQLICGAIDDAKRSLAEAFEQDPDGWADHASTLRQFDLLLTARGADKQWLDAFRPPLSLNFAGHMAISIGQSRGLRAQVDDYLDRSPIGFGYGALAAGADIVIAEALLARNASLHIVLPTSIETFIAQSVTPYEPEWRARFDACSAGATSIRCITSISGAYEPLATKLAADVAMGAAFLNAYQLESRAAQLLVVDDGDGAFGSGLATRYFGERWMNGAPQHLIAMPRGAPVLASGLRTEREGRPDRRLVALIMIRFAGIENEDDGGFAEAVDTLIRPFEDQMQTLAAEPTAILPHGNNKILAFDSPEAAWRYAVAAQERAPEALSLRIAAHYAVVHQFDHPLALVGCGISELERIVAAAIPGVTVTSETFATALSINCGESVWAEHIGEIDTLKLFALSPRVA
jgi:hypothetical protein